MPNIIKPKRSYTASNTPSLASGELAIQCADKKVLIGNSTGTGSILVASLNLSDMVGTTDNITQGSTNKYYADSLARAAISSSATGLTYTSGTGAFSFTAGYSIPTTSSQTNWDSAYTNRITSLTTTGSSGSATLTSNTLNIPTYTLAGLGGQASSTNLTSLAGLTYASASFVKMTASGTFALDTTAYTANTGTVTSIATTSPITGGTITGSGTIGINASSANTASYVVQRDASGNFSAGTITASLTGTASTATNLSGGSGGTIPYQSAAGTTAMLANGTAGQLLQANGGTSAPSWVSTVSGLTVTGLKETKTAPAISTGTLTLNCSLGNVFAVSLNANITTLSFTNVPSSGTAFGLTLMLTADGTARTITWGSAVKWPGGTAPTLTSTNGKVDVFVLLTHDGGTTWYAFTSGQNL